MRTKTPKLAYEAPETSVDFIEMEQCILSTQNTIKDMDYNEVFEEDF